MAALPAQTEKTLIGPVRRHVLPLRFDRHEMAGSLGDIGVMIPLGGVSRRPGT
jgi:hypothetical protein